MKENDTVRMDHRKIVYKDLKFIEMSLRSIDSSYLMLYQLQIFYSVG